MMIYRFEIAKSHVSSL